MGRYLFAALAVAVVALAVVFARGDRTPSGSPERPGEGAVIWIDVRTAEEYRGGHVAGALLLPYDTIEQTIAEAVPDKAARIHLYCRSGRRSGIALDILRKLGYTNAANLGGFEELRQTQPTETTAP